MNERRNAIADNLRKWGTIVDIGQLRPADRRVLNYLTIKGVVAKDLALHFPIPKTRYTWIGTD